jgi:hypothetical protein
MALVAVVVILVCGAGAALAGTFNPVPGDINLGSAGGLKYKLDPHLFNPSNSNYAGDDVYCGSGWHVTAGGAGTSGAISARSLEDSRPFSFGDANTIPDNGWDASGYGPGGHSLTAYAICSKSNFRYLHLDVPDGTTSVRAAKLSCGGPRWHVIGGGAFIATTNSHITSSAPFDGSDTDTKPDDGWAIRVLDTAGGLGGMAIDAICKRGPGLSYVKVKHTGLAPANGAYARANCASGTHVAGGGVRIDGPGAEARVVNSFPADSSDPGKVPDDGWNGAAYNLGGTTKTFVVTAICLG